MRGIYISPLKSNLVVADGKDSSPHTLGYKVNISVLMNFYMH